jgi:hypothetical protein
MSMVLEFMCDVKIPLESHCNHILVNVCFHHMSSQRQADTILARLFSVFILEFQQIYLLIEAKFYSISIIFH